MATGVSPACWAPLRQQQDAEHIARKQASGPAVGSTGLVPEILEPPSDLPGTVGWPLSAMGGSFLNPRVHLALGLS